MNENTIHRLNAINRRFYEITALEFDQTRSAPWEGWERVFNHIKNVRVSLDVGEGLRPSPTETNGNVMAGAQHAAPLQVLDVGCGNGRFGMFLAENLNVSIEFHGMDNNAALLDSARESLAHFRQVNITLEQRDVIEAPPDSGEYDLVVAFGLIHHVPGYIQRQEFMRCLSHRVRSGGWLVFAAWRFYEFDRFRERIVPWDDDLKDAVERHDYLLDWRRGETALRYCHYVDDTEHTALIDATGLEHVETYRADGFNLYTILKNP